MGFGCNFDSVAICGKVCDIDGAELGGQRVEAVKFPGFGVTGFVVVGC